VFKHIVVPLDGSEYSERAVEPARSLAEQYGARLTLLTVMVRFPASRLHIARLDQGSEERGRQYLDIECRLHMQELNGPAQFIAVCSRSKTPQ
jgi:nucleotide-binding universal stress UspA family protein